MPRLYATLLAAHLPLIWLLALPVAAYGDVYQFVDDQGTIHLSNVPTDPRFRKIDPPAHRTRPHLAPRELDRLISHHSARQGIHPALLRAVIKTESGFNPFAISRAGALGLMQLMPTTADRLGVRNPFDPDQNVRGGATHLRALLDRYDGDLTLALAAYNAGVSAVERYQSLPPFRETRRYVAKVLRSYRQYLARTASASRTLTPFWASRPPRSLVFSADPTR